MRILVLLTTLSLILSLRDEGFTWLSEVDGFDRDDSENGYAGSFGKSVCFVRVSGGTHYRVHTVGGDWLPEVTGNDVDDYINGYAGKNGEAIDGFALEGGASYEVHTIDNGWLGVVDGYDIEDSGNGYAGIMGSIIDAIRIEGRTYAVAYLNSEPPTPEGEQVWVNYGTGLRDIKYQSQIPHMAEGCLFMSACVVGGVGTTKHIIEAYSWAVKKGYIRASDTYVYNREAISRGVSEMWGLPYHGDFQVCEGTGHFYVRDGNGKEIFNSAGLGQLH